MHGCASLRGVSSMKDSRATQRGRILELLTSADGAWVPLPKILELKISQFGARILELRRSGLNIRNRTEIIDGRRHSWYRIELREQSAPASAVPTPETMLLFTEGGQ